MGHRMRYRLEALMRAAMLALAGFLLMGSLAVIGSRTSHDADRPDVTARSRAEGAPEPGR